MTPNLIHLSENVVIDQGDWRFKDAVALVAFEPMLEHSVVLSPLVIDAAEYAWWQAHRAPIYRAISSEGVKLWMKPV
jgi:hypothetical protein